MSHVTQHRSPFGKYPAELIASKSEKIFTFTDTPPSSNHPRPTSRTSSFYNGYSTNESSSQTRHNLSLQRSPRRSSQTDCNETNCLNLFHQHNIDRPRSPRPVLVNRTVQSPHSTRQISPLPHSSRQHSPVPPTHSTISPLSEDSLDRLSDAIRHMELMYNDGLVDDRGRSSERTPRSRNISTKSSDLERCCSTDVPDSGRFSVELLTLEPDTLVAFGESQYFVRPDRQALLSANNVAPLFPELGYEPVSIDKVLEVWEEKGLKNPDDPSILHFLQLVATLSNGDKVNPQILAQNVELILTSNEPQSDSLRESALAVFKSVITNLQSKLVQAENEKDQVNSALQRKTEEVEGAMHEYEDRLDLEHKKADDKLRQQKEDARAHNTQIDKEHEQKVLKLHNQMDAIIKRTDKEIKSLNIEEDTLKRIIADKDAVLDVTTVSLKESRKENEKYYQQQIEYEQLAVEYHRLHQSMQQKEKEKSEIGENNEELKRFWEESVDENKKLKDTLDEIQAKYSACKKKLEKAEKVAHSAKRKLKEAQERRNDDDFMLAVDQKNQIKKRLSMAYPGMLSRPGAPPPAAWTESDLEESLNDEILETDSNLVMELQDELADLATKLDDCHFEIERYAKIIIRQQNELESLRGDDENGLSAGDEDQMTPATDHITPTEDQVVVDKDEFTKLSEMVEKNSEMQSAQILSEDKIRELEVEIKSKVDDLKLLKVAMETRTQEFEKLDAESTDLQNKYEEKEKELETLQVQVKLTAESSDKDELVESLKVKLVAFQQQVDLLNGALEFNTAEIDALEEQLEENSKVVSNYEDTVSNYEDTVSNYEETVSEQHIRLEQCKEELSACTVDLETARTQITVLSEEIRSVEHEGEVDKKQHLYKVTELEEELVVLRELQTMNTERAVELAQLEEKSLVSGDLIKRLQCSITELSTELKDTQAALEEAELDCASGKAKVEEMQTVKKHLEAQTETAEQLHYELEQLKHVLEAAPNEEEYEDLQTQNTSLSMQVDELTQFIQVSNDEIQDKCSILAAVEEQRTQENTKSEEAQKELSDKLAASQNKLVTVSEEMNHRRGAYDKEKRELISSLKTKQKEIDSLNDHVEQVERDYEQLVDSLNKETDNRVSELQSQLEETAGISSSLKFQLNDLGQQFIILTGERDRYYKDCAKVRFENERMGRERGLYVSKIEDLTISRHNLELDVEQHIAEYQDMMKCCATLQHEQQEFIDDLDHAKTEIKAKTVALNRSEKEKGEIIQLFEDKIREKEEALEISLAEKSEIEGKVKEKERELSRTKDTKDSLATAQRSLEEQLAGVIQSLDDLTERYEIENTFLEEKVVETMNEVKEVQEKAKEEIEEKLAEQKELMYTEFGEELSSIKEEHQSVVSTKTEETTSAINQFKRKCETKVKEIKEKYNLDLDEKDKTIGSLKGDLVKSKQDQTEEIIRMKDEFNAEKTQLIETLSCDKDKVLHRINQMSDDKIKQLETTHSKDLEIYEEKLNTSRTLSDQLTRDLEQKRAGFEEKLEEMLREREKLKEDFEKTKSDLEAQISDLKATMADKDQSISELTQQGQQNQAEMKENLEKYQAEVEELTAEFESDKETLEEDHENTIEELGEKHTSEIKKLNYENETTIDILVKDHEAKVEDLIETHQDTTEELLSEHQHYAEKLIKEHQQYAEKLIKEHNLESRDLKAERDRDEVELRARLEVIQTALVESEALCLEEIEKREDEIFKKEECICELKDERRTQQLGYEAKLSAKEEETATLTDLLRESNEELEEINNTSFVDAEKNALEISEYKENIANLTADYEQMLETHQQEQTDSQQEISTIATQAKEKLVAIETDFKQRLDEIKESEEEAKKQSEVQHENATAVVEKLKGRVRLLLTTLKTEQAVTRERARQVNELMEVKQSLTEQLDLLKTELKTDTTHLIGQLNQQREHDQESREELITYYNAKQADVERRLDVVVEEHVQCYALKRKVNSLKQQLAVEKTSRNPNSELEQKLSLLHIHSNSLQKQVDNLQKANRKLETVVGQLWEENADLVEKKNTAEHQVHLALKETLKTKSQKVAICNILDKVVHVVTTAA